MREMIIDFRNSLICKQILLVSTFGDSMENMHIDVEVSRVDSRPRQSEFQSELHTPFNITT